MTDPDYKALCAELAQELVNEYGYCTEWEKGLPLCESNVSELLTRARAALAQPAPEGPTDEEIMELMPQQMRDDLAAAARAMGGFYGANVIAAGVMRIIFNRHAIDHARAVLARWGTPANNTRETH